MKKELIFHGSNITVKTPKIVVQGFYKDFGYGFYCTKFEKQAIRWAKAKKEHHIVNVYEYTHSENLSEKVFTDMSDEWLDFIAACRSGKDHSYDIVEGPMADDTVWDYVEDFISGRITRDAFWALARFKKPTHQILFCTENALEKVRFVRSYEI